MNKSRKFFVVLGIGLHLLKKNHIDFQFQSINCYKSIRCSIARPKFTHAMPILNYHFFSNLLFSQSMNPKEICIAGLNVRAGYATGGRYYAINLFTRFQFTHFCSLVSVHSFLFTWIICCCVPPKIVLCKC